MKPSITTILLDHIGFNEDIIYGDSAISNNFQCYHMTKSPTVENWTTAYNSDNSIGCILWILKLQKSPIWDTATLSKIDPEYHSFLKKNQIKLVHDTLVLMKPIFRNIRYIGLIIVPIKLCRIIFSHFHAGPSGGHMGEYKTFFRIRMRFFSNGIWRDIKIWVKNCAHCNAYDIWYNSKNELYFSWPVTTPFLHYVRWLVSTREARRQQR